MTTIHARQIQLTKMHIRKTTPSEERNNNNNVMYRDTTNVEPEMYDYTNNNWSHWNTNEKLRKNLEAVPGKHSIDSLQKTSILGTLHIIRKVLQCET